MQSQDGIHQVRVTDGVVVIHLGRTRRLAHTDGRSVRRESIEELLANTRHAPRFGARSASSNAVTRVRLGRAARPQTGAAYG